MARTNVTPYEDEAGIEKNGYRESPYYYEIPGPWKQRQTDSSIIYSRQLEVEKYWKDYLVFLNVRCGRACKVILNGKEVGFGDDSRHWNEFALNKFLKYGKHNTLVIEALKQPAGALLESNDTPVGLNGDPFLMFKNDPNITDYSLTVDYDAASASGTLAIEASVFNSRKKGKYYLEVEVWDPKGHSFDRMGRWVVFDKKSLVDVDFSRTWGGVEAWSAESPSLYTVVMRLRNEKMEEEEVTGMRFGFRRVEVKDGVLQFNGKPITLKGVVYGTEQTGDYSSREQLRSALQSMKLNNINAVRTAKHSPAVPFFYELCDELGLYVVCDAYLMPTSTQRQAVATDRDFVPMFERRMEDLYGKYKNYTSIIAWSLGETRDNGVCMTAAYNRLKELEKKRPVLFSGADFSETTDVIALDKPSEPVLKQVVAKTGDRPFLILSAGVEQYDRLWHWVEVNRSLQGGFVNEWPLASVMLSEVKSLYSPFSVGLSKHTLDDAEFTIYNRNDFSSFSKYILEYTIYTNLRSNISAGDVPLAIGGGDADKVTLRVPPIDLQPGEEMFVRFDLARRPEGRITRPSADRILGTLVFPLEEHNHSKPMFKNSGELDSIPDLIQTELGFVGHADWKLECVDRRERRPDSQTFCVDCLERFIDPGTGAPMCDVRITYTHFSSGDVVMDYTLFPSELLRGTLLQPVIKVFYAGDSVTWFGNDREVHFREGKSAIVGVFSHDADGVNRQLVRWCATHKGGNGLFVELLDEKFGMEVLTQSVALFPYSSLNFRLHLRPYSGEDPADFYGKSYPRMQSGMLEMPIIKSSEVRFSQPMTITLSAAKEAQIRYTLDGTDPTSESPLYGGPFQISSTTTVKARAFAKDTPPSFTATHKFNYDFIVSTTFSRKPSTPYNVGSDTLLFDGEKGSVENFSQGWLGFSGNEVTTTVELSKQINVESIILRYAHSPETWAFVPMQVTLLLSSDGEVYTDTVQVVAPFDPASEDEKSPRVVEFKVPVDKGDIKYMKIASTPISIIPSWHRAKGLKPWMLMDEIEVSEK